MTRETKISLLVGLAFFIVMGILLTDHLRLAGEPPQAALADAGAAVRQAVNAPGTGDPPIRMVPATDVPPTESVPTHDELTRPAPPVIPSSNSGNNSPATVQEDHGADAPQHSLNEVAQRNGEPLVPANIDGTSRNPDPDRSDMSNPPTVAGPAQYRAQAGDTVSRMAAKLLGTNSRANRQAIINANPSLRDDPDRVIVGQTYVIPEAGRTVMAPSISSANPPAANGREYFYTVQEGDSLWQIANDELGDPSAVDAIKELNQSVLKGKDHETVIPGMKLRLPSKPVATANSSM
ncbi:MAG TPA: LysM peptidoglycan-binding domain-containing protein [Tepidisphaeraceae bacterium]|jgi:nucleoid-associated protein YgaU|nr:LysM peptidoglycan-binding domain-containing protein [Tepidisphaeraceae bacterium]